MEITEAEMSKIYSEFGIRKDDLIKPAETIDELMKRETGMVVVEPGQAFSMQPRDSNIPALSLSKGEPVVMTLGEFNNFKHSKEHGNLFKPYKIKFRDIFRRYRGEDLTNKKLMIWRYGGVGDVVIVQSLVKYLKAKYPSCEISFATSPAHVLSFHSWPKDLLTNVYTMPFKKSVMDSNDYHLTFINAIEHCLESRTMDYYKLIQKVANVDFDAKDYKPELIPIKDIESRIIKYIPDNLVTIHMKPSAPVRTMDPLKWQSIIVDLLQRGYKVGIIDSIMDAKNIDKLIEQFGFSQEYVINLAKLSLDFNYAINIVNLSKGLMTIDSGISHIAAALNKPTVTFYGPFRSDIISGGIYKSVYKIDPPDGWNVCGKYPCWTNQDMSVCPYVSHNQSPGCLEYNDIKNAVNMMDIMIKERENGIWQDF